jgi:hypothetical protein
VNRRAVATLIAALLPGCAFAQDAKAAIDAASNAMGTTGLNSISYSGVAAQGNFGQSRTISFGLASTPILTRHRRSHATRGQRRAAAVAASVRRHNRG